MPGIRTLDIGFDAKYTLSYATQDRCVKEATDMADRLAGVVNVRVLPVIVDGSVRYTAIFSCFSDEQDIFTLVRSGKGRSFILHR